MKIASIIFALTAAQLLVRDLYHRVRLVLPIRLLVSRTSGANLLEVYAGQESLVVVDIDKTLVSNCKELALYAMANGETFHAVAQIGPARRSPKIASCGVGDIGE